ncbi:MAG: 3-keto-5-aminohexanoate cleavage protein [Thermodesulfobacteriota bacterium]
MSNQVMISAAVTGAIHTPTMSPHLPITPAQIAADAIGAAKAGAASVHLHARDPQDGRPSAEVALFRNMLEHIRAECDAIICITTGGGLGMTAQERAAAVAELHPELASFNMGTINFALHPVAKKYQQWKHPWEKEFLEGSKAGIFRNTFADMEMLCQIFRDSGTKPELEIYDVGHLYNAAYVLDEGWLEPPLFLQFVMGILGGIQPTLADLVHLQQTADRLFGPQNYVWSAFGAGKMELPICTAAAFMGGGCRVGLEDNLYLAKGRLARSSGELVEKLARILGEFNLEPATPNEARQRLGLPIR